MPITIANKQYWSNFFIEWTFRRSELSWMIATNSFQCYKKLFTIKKDSSYNNDEPPSHNNTESIMRALDLCKIFIPMESMIRVGFFRKYPWICLNVFECFESKFHLDSSASFLTQDTHTLKLFIISYGEC